MDFYTALWSLGMLMGSIGGVLMSGYQWCSCNKGETKYRDHCYVAVDNKLVVHTVTCMPSTIEDIFLTFCIGFILPFLLAYRVIIRDCCNPRHTKVVVSIYDEKHCCIAAIFVWVIMFVVMVFTTSINQKCHCNEGDDMYHYTCHTVVDTKVATYAPICTPMTYKQWVVCFLSSTAMGFLSLLPLILEKICTNEMPERTEKVVLDEDQ